MKFRFVQFYLASAGLILAVTALGKAIPVQHNDLCIYPPQGLLWLAAALEFGIVGLICFSPQLWLPCLACGLWGALCVLVRLVFPRMVASCHCLGWFEHIIPLPNQILRNILFGLSTWLAVGGLVSFRLTWRSVHLDLNGRATA